MDGRKTPFSSLPYSGSVAEAAAGFRGYYEAMVSGTSAVDEATTWLGALADSSEAWTVVVLLLSQPDDLPPEGCLLAAQMLSNKIQFSFHEVSGDEGRTDLRSTLLSLLATYAQSGGEDGRYAKVLDRLCIALANMALQSSRWENPIATVVAAFEDGDRVSMDVLLTFLLVLAEQALDARIPITFNRKMEFADYMAHVSEHVLSLLHQMYDASGGDPDVGKAILSVFRAWLTAGDFEPESVRQSPLLELALASANDEDTFVVALDTLGELVRFATQSGTEPNSHLAMAVLEHALSLDSVLSSALEGQIGNVAVLSAVFAFFIGLAEHYALLLLDMHDMAAPLVDIMLSITTSPNLPLSIIEHSFMFWFVLAEEIDSKASNEREELRHHFEDSFRTLLAAVAARAAFPDDDDGASAEESESVAELLLFRHRYCSPLFGTAAYVLLGTPALASLCELLDTFPEIAGEGGGGGGDDGQGGQVDGWQPYEAVLFAINSISAQVPNDESEILPQLIQWLPSLPSHPRLTATTLVLLSSYAQWLKEHPDHLNSIVEYVVTNVNIPYVQESAATTLKCICDDCAEHLLEEEPAFAQLFFDALESDECSDVTRVELLRCVGFVISELDAPSATSALARIYQPISASIEATCNELAGGESDPEESLRSLSYWLSLVHALVQASYVKDKEYGEGETKPGVEFMRGAWDLMAAVLELCSGSELICESICDGILKYTIRAAEHDFAEFLEQTLDAMLNAYQTTPFSCFLYVVGLLMKEFSRDDDHVDALAHYAFAFSKKTFDLLGEDHGFDRHPDVIMEYFEMIVVILRRRASIIVSNPELVNALLDCGLEGLQMDHPAACRAVLAFVEHILACAIFDHKGILISDEEHAFLNATMMELGPRICNALVSTVVQKHTELEKELAAVFLNYLRFDVVEFTGWTCDVVDQIPESLVTSENKNDLMESLARSTTLGQVSLVIKELAVIYRMRADRQ